MYELPETAEDFNAKYHRSVGLLTFTHKEIEGPRTTPAYIGRVERPYDDANLFLYYHNIEKNGKNLVWLQATINLKNIVSLEFPIPKTGYYSVDGFFPAYLDRRAVRQVHRGWSDTSLSLTTSDVFTSMISYDFSSNIQLLVTPTHPAFVDAFFNSPNKQPQKFDKDAMFNVLSKDFLSVKTAKHHALLYQNFLVGICTHTDEGFNVKIDKNIREIEDVFYSQMGMR